jgi:hypothetical protein
MSKKLIEESQRIKKVADYLLYEDGLFDFLMSYGKVTIVGAYDTDLMMHGDIDLYVVNKNLDREKSLEAFYKLLKGANYRGYLFFDHVNYRTKDIYPHGYCVGLRKDVEGEKYNFDIWFLREKLSDKEKYNEDIKKRLNDENREIILRLKKYRKDKGLDIPGVVIYQAVLDNRIKTISDFKKFLKEKK